MFAPRPGCVCLCVDHVNFAPSTHSSPPPSLSPRYLHFPLLLVVRLEVFGRKHHSTVLESMAVLRARLLYHVGHKWTRWWWWWGKLVGDRKKAKVWNCWVSRQSSEPNWIISWWWWWWWSVAQHINTTQTDRSNLGEQDNWSVREIGKARCCWQCVCVCVSGCDDWRLKINKSFVVVIISQCSLFRGDNVYRTSRRRRCVSTASFGSSISAREREREYIEYTEEERKGVWRLCLFICPQIARIL